MIRVERLHFAYGRQPVLRGLDLEVGPGEILAVLGPNGCGKSTLLRLLRGVLEPAAGRVLWQGREACRLGRRAMARLAAVVPQSPQVPFPYPVRELVAMGRFARRAGFFGATQADRRAVEKAMALTDTLQLAERQVTDLSGGELQRVLLARALAQQSPVLLLDEATSQLDLDHRLEIAELLVRLNREQGTTVIQVSHDLDLAAETSHRILLLAGDGMPVALGTPVEVFTSANLRRAFRVEVKVERNPYTGAPRAYPVGRGRGDGGGLPRVHLLCGGGSGGELLRRLHLAGAEISVGPLNRGDSDQELAAAIGLETVLVESFCPVSEPALQAAGELCRRAGALVVAPTVWGPGNLAVLEIARQAVERRIPVLLVDPRADRDYTGGRAWERLHAILRSGGQVVPDAEAVLQALRRED
ncbi:iron complex transport system ATP-binding protein [Geothermobacter ehrlichii]|uniref:Iron complex transport system ATP-binding protein n=1 Tax=Geothermobacter ehrlichii TaxID=213224 RepID=A0A5D3WIJ0_9BACT|nr:ABC transporter ATP-binding protein [Geothermobacter ehrlichii]TYO97703.1 iron complex transport system ATP-binding protein [Geothermobacter ehrlichii]